MRTPIALAALAALALPAAATAATPESGAVSPETRKVSWSGTIVDPLGTYDLVAFFIGSTQVQGQETCGRVVCDDFTLTVPEGAQEIRIRAAGDSAAQNVSMDISSPGGERWNLNEAEYATERELIYEAVPGAWTIRVYGTSNVSFDYTASAEINLPGDPSFYPDSEEEPAGEG